MAFLFYFHFTLEYEKESLLITLNNSVSHARRNTQKAPSLHDNQYLHTLYHTMNGLCKTLSKFLETKQEQEKHEQEKSAIIEEWRHLAAILDRIFLLSYLVVILISLIILFPKPWWHIVLCFTYMDNCTNGQIKAKTLFRFSFYINISNLNATK